MTRITLSAYWSDRLKAALIANCTEPFPMSLTSEDAVALTEAWNQGIDSHLEAITGSRAEVAAHEYGRISINKLDCEIAPEDMPVLIRRLLESESEEAQSLACGICECLDIELV